MNTAEKNVKNKETFSEQCQKMIFINLSQSSIIFKPFLNTQAKQCQNVKNKHKITIGEITKIK